MKKTSCLLIHGFGGSSFEMEPLADALTAAGFPVSNMNLPGHGTTLDDFARTGFRDWSEAVRCEYRRLSQTAEQVVVIGLSMGGTLALELGCIERPAGVVALAAPVFLYKLHPFTMTDWRLPFVGLLKHVRRRWPMPPRSAESARISPWRGYEGVMMLPQLHSLLQGMREVERQLPQLKCRLLLMHARKDRTVPCVNALHVAKRVASPDVTVWLFDMQDDRAGHHLITTHRCCRESVVRAVTEFVLSVDTHDNVQNAQCV